MFTFQTRWLYMRGMRAHYSKSERPILQKEHRQCVVEKKWSSSNKSEGLTNCDHMLDNGMRTDLSILLAAIKACSSSRKLHNGTRVHAAAIITANDNNIRVANSLLHMYCKCGRILDAARFFSSMLYQNTVTWNTMIFGYAEIGECQLALQLFLQMQDEGFLPDARTYVAALKSCGNYAAKAESIQCKRKNFKVQCLEKGIFIHSQLIKKNYEVDMFVGSTLVDMYSKCGSMIHARQVFQKMLRRDIVSWSAVIFGYSEDGECELASQLFTCMQDEGFAPDGSTYVAVLRACANCAEKEAGRLSKINCLENGIAIHSQLIKSGCESDMFVASALVDMYAKCGSMVHALWVFDRISHHNVLSWNAIIFGYAESEECELALELFVRMQDQDFVPDARTYASAIKACAKCAEKEVKTDDQTPFKVELLEKGLAICSQFTKTGHNSDIFVASTIVDMYVKCGSMAYAQWFFDQIPCRNLVSWNSLIFGYAEKGDSKLALQLFMQMQDEGFTPEARTYVAALKACASYGQLGYGKQCVENLRGVETLERGIAIHSQLEKIGEMTIFVANTLVDMYAKCGSIVHARQVFDTMLYHDTVSWNALIFGYLECAECVLALHLFDHMQDEHFTPEARTYIAALKACAHCAEKDVGTKVGGKLVKIESLERAISIHSQLAKGGYELDIFVASTLVDMYASCGSMVHAHQAFQIVEHPNLVLWNALIFGYAESENCSLALELFQCMQNTGFMPSAQTYVAALKACASCATKEVGKPIKGKVVKIEYLKKGLDIHSKLARSGHDTEIFVASTLVDMYAKCGSMANACQVFDRMQHHDLVSWNAVIFGHAESEENELALQLFAQMQDEGFVPGSRTYVAVLKACANCGMKEMGKQVKGKLVKMESLERGITIHSQLAKHGFESDIFVASTLVDIYAKCGSMIHARHVFDKLPHNDVVLWNAMLFGYIDSGEPDLSLQLFGCMQTESLTSDPWTYVAALKACATCAAKEENKQVEGEHVKISWLNKGIFIHSQLAKSGHELDIFVANTLVDMYASCGSLGHASCVFDRILHHNMVSWNAVLFGLASNGKCESALRLFKHIQDEGLTPDAQTYVGALKACGNMGALEAGKRIHLQICSAGLQDLVVVADCLIDFYSKCGNMADAKNVFDGMSSKNLIAWNVLLAGYAHQGDAQCVFDLFESMQKECFQADSITFLSVLTACSHSGLVHKGKQYFEVMHLCHMITPGIEHYACMVDLFSRANLLDDAVAMINTMPFKPNLSIWRTLLGACQKWNNVVVGKLAFEAILSLDDKDATAYIMMANILGGSGMQEEISKLETNVEYGKF